MKSPIGGGAEAFSTEGLPRVIAVAVHLLATAVVCSTLWLVGQPIYANDTWIHLALGQAFAEQGPWLAADPYLYAAPGPPGPSSWLGSAAIYWIQSATGFLGLRVAHVAAVATLLVLAWESVRRATGCRLQASLGLIFFVLLSTYRIVQLRPHLFTIGAMLGVYLLVLAPREGPGPRAMALAAVVTALWANIHAAFLLGPLLVLGSALSLGLLRVLPGQLRPADEGLRVRRLALAGLVMWLASLLNPQGIDAHLAYFAAGQETIGLGAVVDEWGPTNLLAWPAPGLPPSPAAWLVCWISLVIAMFGGLSLLQEGRLTAVVDDGKPLGDEAGEREGVESALVAQARQDIDPVLVALSAAAVIGSVIAARFLWLCIFPVALAGAIAIARVKSRALLTWGTVVLAVLGGTLHTQMGDWPLVSRGLKSGLVRYEDPYWAAKYFAHSIWFLKDSKVEGRIYNDYPLGGFMSFWLSPRMQMSSSGTMNVARPAMEANFAIASRSPAADGRSFANVLASQDLDFFLATGLPVEATARKPVTSTMRHLEGEADWVLVFRSLRSAVFMRSNERSSANLERIRAFYESEGVPFDPAVGFDTERVIARAPDWAYAHGMIPGGFGALRDAVRALRDRRQVGPESHALADLYAVLGLYRRSLEVDRAILRASPQDGMALQRTMWSELQMRRLPEALRAAERLEASAGSAERSGFAVELTRSIERATGGERAALIALLPLFGVERGHALQAGIVMPAPRQIR